MKIKDFMTKKLVLVEHNLTVKEFTRLMQSKKITGAPVVDDDGKIIGIVSVTDMIKRSNYVNKELSLREDCYEIDPTTGLVEVHKYYTEELFEKPISCLMTKDIISLSPNDDISKAIKIFLDTPIHRILIMENGKALGIISTKDTIRAMAKEMKG